MARDIKEIKELMDALELIAINGAEIAKDGKISSNDLGALITVLSNAGKIQDGFTGLSNVPAEVKDLSEEELVEVVTHLFRIVKEVQAKLA